MAYTSDIAASVWDLVLSQAWEAFQAGSFPVGAALVDSEGNVEAFGRNRAGERAAPEGRMRGGPLAHAEMDVLAQRPFGDHSRHTLVSTLEPCLLCRSAAMMAGVGRVQYLAADRLWAGLERLPTLSAQVAMRHPEMRVIDHGDRSLFASVLPLAVLLAFVPPGHTRDGYAEADPHAFAIADHIASGNRWPDKRLDLHVAIAHVRAVADEVFQ